MEHEQELVDTRALRPMRTRTQVIGVAISDTHLRSQARGYANNQRVHTTGFSAQGDELILQPGDFDLDSCSVRAKTDRITELSRLGYALASKRTRLMRDDRIKEMCQVTSEPAAVFVRVDKHLLVSAVASFGFVITPHADPLIL